MRGAGLVGGISLENQSRGGHGSGMRQVWAQTSACGLKTSSEHNSMSGPSDGAPESVVLQEGLAGTVAIVATTLLRARLCAGAHAALTTPPGAGPLIILIYSGRN